LHFAGIVHYAIPGGQAFVLQNNALKAHLCIFSCNFIGFTLIIFYFHQLLFSGINLAPA